MTHDLTTHIQNMVDLGLRAAACRRELDQLAEQRRAALCAWISECLLSAYALAPRLGVTRQHLSLLLHGHTGASNELYARVFDLHRELQREVDDAEA